MVWIDVLLFVVVVVVRTPSHVHLELPCRVTDTRLSPPPLPNQLAPPPTI
jgi:hypothetical protein